MAQKNHSATIQLLVWVKLKGVKVSCSRGGCKNFPAVEGRFKSFLVFYKNPPPHSSKYFMTTYLRHSSSYPTKSMN